MIRTDGLKTVLIEKVLQVCVKRIAEREENHKVDKRKEEEQKGE